MAKRSPHTITIVRHCVQALIFALFMLPLVATGWALFGIGVDTNMMVGTPSEFPIFGSLSASTIVGVELMDPYAFLQVTFASKSFDVSWLLAVLPLLVFYGLIRGRVFCGWVCPSNMFLELVDFLRRKLKIKVSETVLPRRTKVWVCLGVLVLSALFSIPLFELFSPVMAIHKAVLFGYTLCLVTFVVIIILELFWGHRVWCRALCPLGGFYEAIGVVGQVTIKYDEETCTHCNKCKKACLADPSILDDCLLRGDTQVRAGDCMLCGACIDNCPAHSLKFGFGCNPLEKPVLREGERLDSDASVAASAVPEIETSTTADDADGDK